MQADEKDVFRPDKRVVYKAIGDIELKLHIFEPDAGTDDSPRPAIVFFHGGGWQRGHVANYYPRCRHMAERGMVAISAEYRIKDQHGNEPIDCLKDAKSAMRYVRGHSDELGIDPDRIASGGSSAGGQLAFMVSRNDGINDPQDDLDISCAPNAVWLMAPVLNMGPDGFSHRWVRKYWEDFSPYHNITEASPPCIIFLGEKDTITPPPVAREFVTKMNSMDRRCELHIYPGAEHRFHRYQVESLRENYYDILEKADAFLVSLGLLEAKE